MNIVMLDNDFDFCEKLAKYLKSNGDFNVVEIFKDTTIAIDYIKENKNFLDLIMIDMDVINLDINTILHSISKNCNIIAFSEQQGTLDRYLNYPFVQRVFQKPVSFSNILNYISIQNGIETYDNYRKFVLKKLSDFGFNINHSGTTYLVEGTTMAAKNKIKKLSEIYTLLAHNHDTDPKIIGWSINNAINKAVKGCEESKLQDFFNIKNDQKLTAKYIINHFINFDHEHEHGDVH